MTADARPVIIYGGSFDPPHRGHLALARAALRQLRPAAFYFVPAFQAPFKDFQPLPFSERRGMLAAALAEAGLASRPEVKISSFEAGLKRVVYTYETVAHFRRLHPGAPLYFLMGSDCLADFRRWRRWRLVLRQARLLAGLRPGYPGRAAAEVPYTALKGRFPEAASSDLRGSLFLGEEPAQLPGAVLARIKSRGLYFSRERALLRRMINPRRYQHSIETARLAVSLAGGLGIPAQKAAAAGLVHDCARDLAPAALRRGAPRSAPLEHRLAEMGREAPLLLHAWTGAELAARKLGIKDPEIAEAVRLHATGAPGMGPLAKLIYVSDLACRGRNFAEAGLIRALAYEDFEAAFRAVNYVKLTHAFSGGGWVHPLSVALWNILQEKKRGS
ncbi:MAG: bis(5'-nucleosyl)-tetraphosphatase (symmetrical) YqeK [Elusimicrobiales bacterium]|nr:bis(5'-nucleosyl)-tetraphosphatase (symmetrical) YqeK [Elusimicrobiales bacterium]